MTGKEARMRQPAGKKGGANANSVEKRYEISA
jgi:hypothetical protein